MSRSALAFPKPIRMQDPDYLRFIRRQPCLIDHAAAEAHHCRVGGIGTKCSDYRTVPLCRPHHKQLHAIGRVRFEQTYKLDLNAEQIRFLEMYISALKDGEDLGGK